MKPHEETWRARDEFLLVVSGPDPDSGDLDHLAEFHTVQRKPQTLLDAEARARLAAQAPAMARLILRLAREMQDGTVNDVGQICFDMRGEIDSVLAAGGLVADT